MQRIAIWHVEKLLGPTVFKVNLVCLSPLQRPGQILVFNEAFISFVI